MAKKESTIVYDKHVDICEQYLTDEQFGKLMFTLVKDKDPDFGDDKILAMAYEFIALQKDLDDKKYEERCRKNRENGRLGGRPKKGKEKPKKANGFFENPNDNENEKDNDKDNDDDARFSHETETDHHDSILHLGSFGNVDLTDQEHAALKQQYERPEELIDEVSLWLRSAKHDVPDHYALCVKFATNDQWPKRKPREHPKPVIVEDPLDPEEQERMMAEMQRKINGAFASG